MADPPWPINVEELLPGAFATIAMLPHVVEEWNRFREKERGRVERAMKNYAAGRKLPREQFRFESREKVGDERGTTVGVWTFKGWQIRVYGIELRWGATNYFVCSEIDTDKKRDKADPACLRRAAQNVRVLVERRAK